MSDRTEVREVLWLGHKDRFSKSLLVCVLQPRLAHLNHNLMPLMYISYYLDLARVKTLIGVPLERSGPSCSKLTS